MKFSTRLSIVITALFLAGFCAMFYLGYTSTIGIMEANVRERLEGQAYQIIDKIDRMLFERIADMNVLAGDPVLRSRTATPRLITQRLAEYRDKYGMYSSLSFFDMNRVRIADTSGNDIGKRHALTAYWQKIDNGGDSVMTVVESQTTKSVVFHFVKTVNDAQGRRIGVIAARMPAESIQQIADLTFRSGRTRESARVELLDANGLILYSNYHEKDMLRKMSSDWEQIKQPLARGAGSGSSRHAFQDEEEEITAFAREQGYDAFKGNGWVLTLCIPVKTAFAAANGQAIKFSVLFLGIGVLMILCTFLVSRAATSSLGELSNAATEIGKGNLDVSVKVRSNDEIGLLAQSFNTMAADLRESENKYKDLAELLPQIIFEVDARGKIAFVNRHGLEIFGYTRQDIDAGLDFVDVFAPQERNRLRENMQKRLSGETSDSVEYIAIRKDGSTFPFLAFSVPIRQGGKTLGIRGLGIDITERKKTEQEIRKFESLVQNSLDFIGIASLDGRIQYLNPAAQALVGLDGKEESATKRIFDFFFDEDLPRMQRTIAEKKFWRGEFRLRHFITHAAIPVEMTGFTITDLKTGQPIALATVNRDITLRKKSEEALRTSEERYRTVVDNLGIGISLISPDMEILSLNRQMKEWSPAIDVSQRPICFRSFNRPPREDICSYCPTVKTLKDGLVHAAITETPTEAGIVNYQVTSSPLKDGEGNVIAAIELVEDITERKRWEDEIRRLNQELETRVRERTRQLVDTQEELVRKEKLAVLGQIAGSVGHELRNPLGVMNNAVYYLQTVLPNADETTREYLGIIKSEIFGAERIVSDLLDAVRTKPPHPQSVPVEELIRTSLGKCRIPETTTVDIDLKPNWSVIVDPLQMKQVLINLINNAADAMSKDGRIRISARSDSGKKAITIKLEDEGTGIAPGDLPKIFQPLFTTKARGIGLGLVVAKNLTEANGGQISVESTVSAGTTFFVTLPAAETDHG